MACMPSPLVTGVAFHSEQAMNLTPILLLASLLGLGSCGSFSTGSQAGIPPAAPTSFPVAQTVYTPDLPISPVPYESVQASWKQRLDQPYVYLEHVGSYTETCTLLPALHRELRAQGLEPSGAPFGLFYDDPALVEAGRLRSRACVPIAGARSPKSPLAYDVLPSTTVCYAFVAGEYSGVPRAYPGIYRFMQHMNWVENGPIREIYLVAPNPGTHADDLICEIQIPATQLR